jgi:hypothetical protein
MAESTKERRNVNMALELERWSTVLSPLLVMSSSGGLGLEADIFYKRLASLLPLIRDLRYSHTISYIRRISFSLIRSSIYP